MEAFVLRGIQLLRDAVEVQVEGIEMLDLLYLLLVGGSCRQCECTNVGKRQAIGLALGCIGCGGPGAEGEWNESLRRAEIEAEN